MNTDNLKRKILGLLMDARVPDAAGLLKSIMELVQGRVDSAYEAGRRSANPLTPVRWMPSKRNARGTPV